MRVSGLLQMRAGIPSSSHPLSMHPQSQKVPQQGRSRSPHCWNSLSTGPKDALTSPLRDLQCERKSHPWGGGAVLQESPPPTRETFFPATLGTSPLLRSLASTPPPVLESSRSPQWGAPISQTRPSKCGGGNGSPALAQEQKYENSNMRPCQTPQEQGELLGEEGGTMPRP